MATASEAPRLAALGRPQVSLTGKIVSQQVIGGDATGKNAGSKPYRTLVIELK
jgi:hypothetical protein